MAGVYYAKNTQQTVNFRTLVFYVLDLPLDLFVLLCQSLEAQPSQHQSDDEVQHQSDDDEVQVMATRGSFWMGMGADGDG